MANVEESFLLDFVILVHEEKFSRLVLAVLLRQSKQFRGQYFDLFLLNVIVALEIVILVDETQILVLQLASGELADD